MACRVLITGHLGYLGSVFVPRFLEAGHSVTGLDTGYFEPCRLDGPEVPAPRPIAEIRKDLRDLAPTDLRGFDAVVHLAALSNDPIGNLNSRWTSAINETGSLRLAELARAAGVSRFLFSSSCIMYGAAGQGEVDETSPLDPKTDYARSKAVAERAISSLANGSFSPVFLRNGTIYGLSPRMRLDTVTNQFTASALTAGVVAIHGDGTPWRPVVHVEDVASAFLCALEAPRERLHNRAINVGAEESNHTIMEIAEEVARQVKGSRIERLSRPDADSRTYRARFDLIGKLLPGFRPRWSLARGVDQLRRGLSGLDRAACEGPKYVRLRWLASLIERGAVDSDLRLLREREVAA